MQSKSIPVHVFVCYSHLDEAFARRIAADLERNQIPVWVDREGLTPGTINWENTIREAVSRAHAVLLIATPRAKESIYVHAELSLAETQQVKVIPLWAEGDRWIDCVPLAMSKTQYIDCRESGYKNGLLQLVALLETIVSSNTPKHQLIRNVFERDELFAPNAYPSYVGVLLHEPYWTRPRDLRSPKNDDMVLFNPRAYKSLSAVLDDLYLNYLQDRYEPLTYGRDWVLAEYNRPVNPGRLIVPWSWLFHTDEPVSQREPYWATGSLEQYGLVTSSVWEINEPATPNKFEHAKSDTCYGIAVNNRHLYAELLSGSGKQPHPAINAGYLEVVPLSSINPDDYTYLVVTWDNWSGKPFAGKALKETDKPFNPARSRYAWLRPTRPHEGYF